MDDKVYVISTVTGMVSINLPDFRFRRDWPKKGTKVAVSKDILREIIYDPGTEYMFKTGMLYIDDLDFKIELGLEPESAEKPENVIVLNEKQMDRYARLAPVSEMREMVSKLSKEQRKNFFDYLVENEITDIARCDAIKELCGFDLLQAVTLNRKNKED